MALRGIDVSACQSGIDLSKVDCDFVIAKTTGGTSYASPSFRAQADQALKLGRRLGAYHFAGDGSKGTAAQEAANFLKAFEPYKGKAVPILDWESDAVSWPTSWALEWLETVERATGSTPWFYCYSNAVNSHDYSKLAKYPLWIAAYYAGYQKMGWQSAPPLIGGTGNWKNAACYQYTSSGQVGYNGNLDLSIFYGTAKDWDGYVRKEKAMPSLKKFVERMDYYCRVASVGYDQYNRWDVRDGGETDCSALVIWCLNEAGFDTGEAPKLKGSNPTNGASYTGNMSAYLTARGWKRLPFKVADAKAGDILLNDAHHVAAVIKGSGALATIAQASIDERGQATGGLAGDQGDETNERPIYDYPWSCILRWTGTNDIELEEIKMTLKEIQSAIWGYKGAWKNWTGKSVKNDADANQLLNQAARTWSYRNPKCEEVDAYQILRDIRDGVVRIEDAIEGLEDKLDGALK